MQAAKLAGAAFVEMGSDAPTLGPVDIENLSTGGAFGSQAATMSSAKANAVPFTQTNCDKSGTS
jgi:hypothetical protein